MTRIQFSKKIWKCRWEKHNQKSKRILKEKGILKENQREKERREEK